MIRDERLCKVLFRTRDGAWEKVVNGFDSETQALVVLLFNRVYGLGRGVCMSYIFLVRMTAQSMRDIRQFSLLEEVTSHVLDAAYMC